ncbi:MAG: dCMP deaminase family protein [Christensenellaceae bacterium]|jgi:dCMP deaminase|nr:dCMP deaminase family protein [Christensenellaceae bacterium]
MDGKGMQVLNWDETFMYMATLFSMRSSDPNTRVGAVIVNQENEVVSIGYNGMPRGADADAFPWERESPDGDPLKTKYFFAVHAERNAILNAARHETVCKDCKIYVSLFPCNECAKEIVQSGIKEIIYLSDKYHDEKIFIASRMILEACGIKTRQLKLNDELVLRTNV